MQHLKKNRSSRKENEQEKSEIFRIPTVYKEAWFGLRQFIWELDLVCKEQQPAAYKPTSQETTGPEVRDLLPAIPQDSIQRINKEGSVYCVISKEL